MLRAIARSRAWVLALLFTAACPAPTPTEDGGVPDQDAGAQLARCGDNPDLLRAPDGQLPCELLPPNFKR